MYPVPKAQKHLCGGTGYVCRRPTRLPFSLFLKAYYLVRDDVQYENKIASACTLVAERLITESRAHYCLQCRHTACERADTHTHTHTVPVVRATRQLSM